MLEFLKESKQLTDLEVSIDLIEEEIKHKTSFRNYLREIPPDFLSFYNKVTKRHKVEEHLKRIYGKEDIDGHTIDVVVKRLINLARVLTSNHRSDYEDKLGQTEYKKTNWNIIRRCQVCGYKFKNWQEASLEHVLPLSLGGMDNSINWQLLCKRCNSEKSSLFGISTINRPTILSDMKIFKSQSLIAQLEALPKNYRYLSIEKNNRRCCACLNDNTNKQLYVTILEKNEILSFDNLYVLCEVCLRAKSIPKVETL